MLLLWDFLRFFINGKGSKLILQHWAWRYFVLTLAKSPIPFSLLILFQLLRPLVLFLHLFFMIALILFQLLRPLVLFLQIFSCNRINTIPTITSIRIIFTSFFLWSHTTKSWLAINISLNSSLQWRLKQTEYITKNIPIIKQESENKNGRIEPGILFYYFRIHCW